jgi:uncharacterized protein (DUF4415 family)
MSEMKNRDSGPSGIRQTGNPGSSGKIRITIRLDGEILDWFRAQANSRGGGNYQTLINSALKDWTAQGGESLETVLRRVIREELKNAGGDSESFVIPRGRL